jgi:WD40 repeat protein
VLAPDRTARARTLTGHRGEVLGVDISSDGTRVVSAGQDGSFRLWHVADGSAQILRSGDRRATDVEFNDDGTKIVGVGYDRRVRLWDARSGAEERDMSGDGRELAAVAFSADGDRVAAAGVDGVTRVWSTAGGPPLAELRGQRARIYDIGFGATSDRVVSAADDGSVRLWELGPIQSWVVPSLTFDIDFDREGRTVATSSVDGTVRVWDAATGRLRTSLPGPPGYTAVEFSPADNTLLLPSYEGARVRLWPISQNSAETIVGPLKNRKIQHASFDSRGERIVYVDSRGKIVVRELATGREMTLGGTPKTVYGAWFSPDGKRVAAIPDRDILVWRLDRPERPERVLRGHRGPVNELDFSSDGRIVTAGADRTVRVWTLDGRPPIVMRGHEDEVSTALFTADGRQVLSSGADGTLRLFDSRTGVTLAVLPSEEGELYDVALSRDGRIATLGKGEVVRVSDCDVCGTLERVRALADSRAPRPLTAEERRQYQIDAR